MITRYYISVAAAAMIVPGAAHAQGTPETVTRTEGAPEKSQPGQPGKPASSSGQAVGAADAGKAEESEIVVTAQRRSERLTDVPIAITAITAERLTTAGLSGATDLGIVTPGLTVPALGAFAQPTIRGIGSSTSGPGADANVAIYVDGVYQPNQSANIFDFNAVEQIEVLKGPQGTLFGRNATGGAILVKTLKPSYNAEARLGMSYGRFNDLKFNAYLNLPIVADKIALNVAAVVRREDGYIRNVALNEKIDDRHLFGIRSKLLFDVTDNFSVTFTGGFTKDSNPRFLAFGVYDNENNILINNPSLPRPRDRLDIVVGDEPLFKVNTKNASMIASLDTAIGTFSATTGFLKTRNNLEVDGDNTSIVPTSASSTFSFYVDRQQTFSQELNFASEKMGIFSFVAGLYYYNDKASRDLSIARTKGFPTLTRTYAGIRTDAYAAFAEANFDVTDRLHLITGLRYNRETKDAFGVRLIGAPLGPLDAQVTYTAFTPRASVRYEITDNANVYATYSRGFKSGIYNAIQLAPGEVRPEKVDAYEVGAKYGSHGTTFATSAFYYNYTDIQVQSTVATSILTLTNAATATIYGADAEFGIDVTDELRLQSGVAYTHGRYDKFPGAQVSIKDPITGLISLAKFPNNDASGNKIIRTPEWTAEGTATYTKEFDSGKFGLSATVAYNGPIVFSADNRARQGGYTLINGEISWTTPDNGFRFALWGRNLLDETYFATINSSGGGSTSILERPRTYGISLGANF